jgi:hypothetical protein
MVGYPTSRRRAVALGVGLGCSASAFTTFRLRRVAYINVGLPMSLWATLRRRSCTLVFVMTFARCWATICCVVWPRVLVHVSFWEFVGWSLALGSPRPCWVRRRWFGRHRGSDACGLVEGVGLAWGWWRVGDGWLATGRGREG